MAGQKIGRYEVIRELGRGGMAIVYLARDPSFGRQVAVKVLPHQFTDDKQFRVRFEPEAKVIAALEHAYIVPVYDYGEEGDQPFIVMRYMPGGTLANLLAAMTLPLAEIVRILDRLAEALDEAHFQNIIHRDLKPSNVLFDARGRAFLSDFGIAKMLEASVALSGSGVVGTPAYMSPEQAAGEGTIDHRSDVYSLGVILYEMLTGRHPYDADTPRQLMLKHVTEPVPQLATADLTRLVLPANCNPILARALAKKREDRYLTAGALAEATRVLSRRTRAARQAAPIAQGAPSRQAAPSPSTPSGPAATAARQPTRLTQHVLPRAWLVGGAGLLVISALAAMVIFLSAGGEGEPTPTRTVIPTVTITSFPAVAPTVTAAPPATEPAATAHIVTPSPTETSSPSPTGTHTSSPLPATATAAPPATATRRPATRAPPTSTPLPQPTNTPLPQPTNTPLPPPPPTDTPPPAEPPTSTPPPP